jgi:hypothetical protein
MARTAYVSQGRVDYNGDPNSPNPCWLGFSAVMVDDGDAIPEHPEFGREAGADVALSYGATPASLQADITAFVRDRWDDQTIEIVFL